MIGVIAYCILLLDLFRMNIVQLSVKNGITLIYPIFTSLRNGNRPHRIVGQPLVTANDVGHWDQKHPKVLIVGKKREEFDSHV